MTYRFRDMGVRRSPLIFRAPGKFAVFRYFGCFYSDSLDIDFIFGILVGALEALHQQ